MLLINVNLKVVIVKTIDRDGLLMNMKLREEKLFNKKAGSNPKRSPPGMMKAYFDFVAGNWMRVA